MSATQGPPPADSHPLELALPALERELEENRKRLRTIIEATPDLIVFSDLQGHVLYINPAGRRMLGLGESEDVSHLFFPDCHPEWAAALLIRESIPTALREGVWRGESVLRGAGGREIPVSQTVLSHKAPDGTVEYISSIAIDISDQKRAEGMQQLLNEATTVLGASLDYETTLRSLVRFVVTRIADGCVVSMVDEKGQVDDVAVAHVDEAKEQRMRPLLHRIRPLDDQVPVGVHKVLRSGELELVSDVTEIWLRAALRGEERLRLFRELGPRSAMIAPLRARGRTFGSILFLLGDSGRRFSPKDCALGQELARRAALAIDNSRYYQTAQQAIRARDDVLGVVAHDLRSPLNTIATSASLLLRAQSLEEQGRRHVELIQRSTERMDHLIQDLLDVSRLEAGSLPIERRSEDVASLVTEAREGALPLAQEKHLQLETEVEGELPLVQIDRRRILQVLSNLLGNALKFTPPGGRISLKAVRVGEDLRISVSDTGPGIADEQREHVFDRFWQAPETARAGTGLGLAIAKGLVEAHRGTIWVESRPGEGSTFHFTLPLAGSEQVH